MENKQTAVEWLYDRFLFAGYAVPTQWKEQAKQMEKEQITNAYLDSSKETCWSYGEDPPSDDSVYAEEYYNKTYANDTTKGLPEEDSKRRAWHY